MPTYLPSPRLRFRFLALAVSLGLTIPALAAPGTSENEKTGEQIYRKQCASCHGMFGEGTDDYPRSLAGTRSVAQLSRLIDRTMPEDDPSLCVGEDAEKVAAYIYDAFYSPTAQERNQPPRLELSRLTVRQYRHAVADLIGGFRSTGSWDDRQGLQGEYYTSRRVRTSERAIERLDPTIGFDFGDAAPDPETFPDPNEFSIRWQGTVRALETGEYEFIVRTDHAARLWVNDLNQPLIDAGVKSGNDTEYRGSLFLLGGRVYPLRLEFSKGKQGVADKKKSDVKPSIPASIALEWKPPHRAAEVIPAHCLSPNRFPTSFVAATPFPPDDRSAGYERGTSISQAWEQATTDGAIEVAAYVMAHLDELSGVRRDASDRAPKLREFAVRFAERAFRRPLSDDQKSLYVDRQFAEARDPDAALKRVLLLVLKSPRFLYREIGGGPLDGYDVAARLSFSLWDSLPDQVLLNEAAAGRLTTAEQVSRQAERMVSDLRTRAKLREFFLQWLKVEDVPDVAKDTELFPGFDAALASDLRTSLELFLDEVMSSPSADFRELLLSDHVYLNGRLAQFYGADLPPNAPFQKVKLQPEARAGILSHPYLMSTFAYTASSSPIHRGVFLARSVLGRGLRPPPEAVAPLAPDLHAGLTTRERVILQTSPQACQTCHNLVNPLGFALEHFDAVGRYRDQEKDKPIDALGRYETLEGDVVQFNGARPLAQYLADSDEAQTAFVAQLFHYLVKQPIRAFGPRTLADLHRSFVESESNINRVMVEILTVSALKGRDDGPTLSQRR
jgi:hypothetical protein